MEQLDFIIRNYTGFDLTFELFNPLNSFLNVGRGGDYTNPLNLNVDYTPYGIWLRIPPGTGGGIPQPRVASLSFDIKGNLVIADNSGALAGVITCEQYPYRSLLQALIYGTKFQIQFIRMNTTISQIQLLQDVTEIVYKPLTSKYSQNVYTPTIDPLNYIPKLNDFKEKITIDATRGILYKVLPGETVKWNVNFIFL
jgi:hypothetical protein